MFTIKDLNLTKAHVNYLESQIISLADDSGRLLLDNSDRPSTPSLPRSDVASMEEYVEPIKIVLSSLGYPVLEPLVARKVEEPEKGIDTMKIAANYILFSFSGQAFSAKGVWGDEGFIVLAGSEVARDIVPSTPKHIQERRDAALADGSVAEADGSLRVVRDSLFKSPSAAACFVSGSSRNGKHEWRDANGKNIGEIEDEQASAADAADSLEAETDRDNAVQHQDSANSIQAS